jgi:SAM-dependent methyltransferase
MSSYTPRKYWTNLAENYGEDDRKGFSPILHPGAPQWFNLRIDNLQERAWLRALSLCRLREGASILDAGCGTGRWVRRYSRIGYSPVGLDGSLSMLRRAIELRTLTPLVGGELQSLPFRDQSFDCVSVITVIQHIPEPEQQRAIREAVRVTRQGGYLILLEIIRGRAAHVVSHRPVEWIEHVRACGPELISWFGQEFLLFDRMVTGAASLSKTVFFGARRGNLPVSAGNPETRSKFGQLVKRLYWGVRCISVSFSAWAEPLAGRICPPDWATHAAFVFRKPPEGP